jgi:bifunctional non-homologous end joining protein LigD
MRASRGKRKSSGEEQLATYRRMRDFDITQEPRGGRKTFRASAKTLPFVIQKHHASRLHYDFRLGWREVLKSWAVAKGPSYFPGDKRLAIQVEDHPMEYASFEGTIPEGQYGAGSVMVWDEGTWEPREDPDEGLAKGRLKFSLHGKKLKGNWTLVRMGGKGEKKSKSSWLLIKEHDQYEYKHNQPPITETAPNSAVSGRTLEEIAERNGPVWQSNRRKEKAQGGTTRRAS